MKTVLFVCVHNSGRSQMAEAFFNRLAKGRAKAVSAGTSPGSSVNPVVVEAMRETGIDISGNKPKALTIEMAENADRMITMGCGADAEGICPASIIETEDWELDDPNDQPIERVREIRDEVKKRVIALIDELNIK
jgi:arsenate reductase